MAFFTLPENTPLLSDMLTMVAISGDMSLHTCLSILYGTGSSSHDFGGAVLMILAIFHFLPV